MLVKYGVPWETAFNMSNDRRVAILIMFGEIEGREFDWSRGQFVEKK